MQEMSLTLYMEVLPAGPRLRSSPSNMGLSGGLGLGFCGATALLPALCCPARAAALLAAGPAAAAIPLGSLDWPGVPAFAAKFAGLKS